ncbi:MAG TPA: four helix bundle protein [Saprospiraceae bacterium]|nr:four helix bundle protein [Saprospiraceae bacterium]
MSKSIRKPAQVLEDRLIDFATRILDLVEALPNTAVGRHLGGQIMRSGTAPALNYGEAQAAESKADFVHKMKICLKELRETNISLKIIFRRNWFPKEKLNPIMDENNELIAIFMASIKTALTQTKHS